MTLFNLNKKVNSSLKKLCKRLQKEEDSKNFLLKSFHF